MPTWKKVVISGSGVAQLSNDANYLVDAQTGAILTGSFSGSFVGDGSGLTNIVAPGTISSSAQIASDISGAFGADSASFSTRVTDLESFSSSLDNTFASEAELNASSSTLQTNIDGVQSFSATASSSLAVRLTTIEGDNATQTELDAVSSSLASDITSVGNDLTTASSSLASRLETIEGDNATQTELDAVSSSLAADITSLGDTYATDAELNASSSTLQTNLDNASASLAADIASNDVDIAGLKTFSGSVDTALTFDNTNVTVAGNLEVLGTASISYLQSVTGSVKTIGDAYIVLNADSDGERYSGIKVFDSGSLGETGSLEYDSVSNHWFYESTNEGYASTFLAGPRSTRGALEQISKYSVLIGDGGNHMTSSAITDSGSSVTVGKDIEITGNIAVTGTVDGIDLQANSSSLATRLTTIEDDNATQTELNASSSTLQTNIDGVQTNLDTASGSLAGRLTTIEGDNATQTELDAVSSSLAADITSLGDTYATDAELNASSSTLQGNIDTLETNTTAALNASSSALTSAYQSADTAISTSLASDIATEKARVDAILLSADADKDSFAEIVTLINSVDTENDNAFAAHYTSSNNRLDALETDSGSFSTRLTTIEGDNATQTELDAVSSSLAASLAGLSQSEITNTGGHSLSVDTDGTATLTSASSAVLEIGDVYGQNDGSVDIKVPAGAGWLELNYADTDFVYLDGSNMGINLDNTYEWTFFGASGLAAMAGEVRIPQSAVFSGSLFTNNGSVTATNIYGTINADNNVVSSSAQTIANLGGTSIVSSSAQTIANLGGSGVVSSSVEGDAQGQIKINGVNVDINALGASDSPTFNNLTVNGNFTTLGTVTNVNATDLNVEDKFILLNSGSSTGNSGLIVQTSATVGQGSALFWDDATDRWSLDFSGADSTADTATADAYVAAVVTTDDVNYQKVGNIRVDTGTGEAYIYTS